jgi:3-oxoacyl-[acyl-carrier protein] reductase
MTEDLTGKSALVTAASEGLAVVPSMRERGGGAIVFVGSSSLRNPPPHLLLSSVMRLGVAGLAKTPARSLAPDNIGERRGS